MTPEQITASIIGLGLLAIFLFISMPVGVAMGLAGIIGVMYLEGTKIAMNMIPMVVWSALDKYSFTVVPMFVFMGVLAVEAGFSKEIFEAAHCWVGGIRGSLAMATTLAAAGFGTICGSGMATTATFSKICVPEMRKAGYDERLAIGCVCASGPLAAIIPPSIIMVYYGMITDQSIGKMLLAGFLPGFMLAALYIIVVAFRAWRDPKIAPATLPVPWRLRFSALLKIWPVILIAGSMLVGIYTGIFTPTEGGAFGALTVLIIGFAYRRLRLSSILAAVNGSVKIIGMLVLIVTGAFIFNHMIAVTNLTTAMVTTIEDKNLPPYLLLIGMMVILLICGCFMDTVAMMFLFLPLFFPMAVNAGFDPIWFGILIVVNCEIGMETPPFGLALFAAKGAIPDISMGTIIAGTFPFVIADIFGLIILIVFPQISTVVPNMMMG